MPHQRRNHSNTQICTIHLLYFLTHPCSNFLDTGQENMLSLLCATILFIIHQWIFFTHHSIVSVVLHGYYCVVQFIIREREKERERDVNILICNDKSSRKECIMRLLSTAVSHLFIVRNTILTYNTYLFDIVFVDSTKFDFQFSHHFQITQLINNKMRRKLV